MFAADPNTTYESHLHKCIPSMCSVIPEGRSGDFYIKHFDVTPEMAFMFNLEHVARSAYSGVNMECEAGPCCSLMFDSDDAELFPAGFGTMMSDAQMERRSNRRVLREAHGDVLIAGLGLGLILTVIPFKDSVRSVTVIEQSQDVVNLVWPSLHASAMESLWGGAFDKVNICMGDCYDWKPPRRTKTSASKKYDCIYLDIWPDISHENLPGIAKLKRRYTHWLNKSNPSAWMGAWVEAELKEVKERIQRQDRLREALARRMAIDEASGPMAMNMDMELIKSLARAMCEGTGYGPGIVFL